MKRAELYFCLLFWAFSFTKYHWKFWTNNIPKLKLLSKPFNLPDGQEVQMQVSATLTVSNSGENKTKPLWENYPSGNLTRYLLKLFIHLMTCNSTLQIYTQVILYRQNNLCTKLFIVALFKGKGLAIAQMSINRSLFKLWYIHTMAYSVLLKKKKERGCSLSTDLLGERHTLHRRTVYYLLLYEGDKYEFIFCANFQYISIYIQNIHILYTEKLWKHALDTDNRGRVGMVGAKLGRICELESKIVLKWYTWKIILFNPKFYQPAIFLLF